MAGWCGVLCHRETFDDDDDDDDNDDVDDDDDDNDNHDDSDDGQGSATRYQSSQSSVISPSQI